MNLFPLERRKRSLHRQRCVLCIEYSQASNLEFMIRYGFKVDKNPYGARQFDLSGEPLQAYCPSAILRYDMPEVGNGERGIYLLYKFIYSITVLSMKLTQEM